MSQKSDIYQLEIASPFKTRNIKWNMFYEKKKKKIAEESNFIKFYLLNNTSTACDQKPFQSQLTWYLINSSMTDVSANQWDVSANQ